VVPYQWSQQIDDDLDLSRVLKGKAWPSLPADLIELHALNLPLLTPSALAAFLPAWLLRALEENGEKVVREYVVCLFSPHNPEANWQIRSREERLSILTEPQRHALAEFLILVCEHEASEYVRLQPITKEAIST
jgi:hypothetical protein